MYSIVYGILVLCLLINGVFSSIDLFKNNDDIDDLFIQHIINIYDSEHNLKYQKKSFSAKNSENEIRSPKNPLIELLEKETNAEPISNTVLRGKFIKMDDIKTTIGDFVTENSVIELANKQYRAVPLDILDDSMKRPKYESDVSHRFMHSFRHGYGAHEYYNRFF